MSVIKSLLRNRRPFAGDQILYMQVRLHSFFFFVSAFFSVFIFLVDAEDVSKAANAMAVTPDARMRATIVFFIPFYLIQKLLQFLCRGILFFMNSKKFVHILNPFKPGFLFATAIRKVCFILAALVPGVFALSIQKRKRLR